MNDWVVDSSFALAWSLPDERSAHAERFFDRLTSDSMLWVPSLWWYEIANVLLMAERRGRLQEAQGLRILELYRSLPLETDAAGGPELLWKLRTLGREHGLSAYDASYLELAARRQMTLASFDKALILAARKIGIKTL